MDCAILRAGLMAAGLISLTNSIPIDNSVILDPFIECLSDRIAITLDTRNPWSGRLYAKGHRDDSFNPACTVRGDGSQNRGRLEMPFDECGVKRSRSLQPRGVYVHAEIVMSFHPLFVTKVDKAYRIQCFYMEADKTVSAELEVSMLTTGVHTVLVPMPVCEYTIRDGPDREQSDRVAFALIGQQVWHHWACHTDTADVFCMSVFDCKVQDTPGGQTVQLIDESGCALDKHILDNLEYPTDLSAVKEAHAFRFNERPSLYFDCQIKITVKDVGGECPRPVCSPLLRAKRRADTQQPADDFGTMDVSPDRAVFVADVDVLANTNDSGRSAASRRPIETAQDYCLAADALHVRLTLAMVLTACSIAVVAFFAYMYVAGRRVNMGKMHAGAVYGASRLDVTFPQ